MGTLSGVTAMAFAWVNVEIDKEGTSGYERTTTVSGRKAYERYDKATRTGELDVIVAGRFIVGAKATGVEMKRLPGGGREARPREARGAQVAGAAAGRPAGPAAPKQ